MKNKVSRRTFIGTSATAAAAFTVIPNHAMGSVLGHQAPSDKLNVAVVGAGGMGNANLKRVKPTENIVALCDVDWKYTDKVFKENPGAKKYWDWRKMYDEMGKSIDAVIVATADHTHAIIAATAMTMGKHVYVQKPLTHSVYESRLLTKLAEKYKVATSMGNQGSSAEGVDLVCEWIQNGEIGEVKKVDTFTDRPIWPQGLNTPKNGMWVPDTLNWDLFTGPAKMRPYHEIYHPWNWRGWWEYGTGALGDMACHIMHPIFKGLKLGYPTKVQGSSTLLLTDCAPTAQAVKFTFPARANMNTKKVKYPEVEVCWYDGGIKPMMPNGWPEGKNMNDSGGAAIFYGTKDTLICGCYGVRPWLLSGRTPNAPKTERRVEKAMEGGHEMDWVRACKENPATRIETKSPFKEAGPFNEMVVMGVLGVRLQALNKELLWDGPNMKFTNIGDSDKFNMVLSDDFKIVDGHPSFNKPSISIDAKPFAEDLIKHTYRDGWSLPAMP
ncbi:MAG: Gfo/Idh/MocA family oxidoreductase [Bacteroidales bacterium]|jgi:hypothetical protein|nr:Gfo/Idh/MocA family oxidoreductase [Bacteroidales bacterium]